MKDVKKLLWLTIIIFELFACSNQPSTIPEFTDTKLPATPTIQQITVEPSLSPQATAIVPPESPPFDPALFPLSERGPYWTGRIEYFLFDASRDGREISLTIWYPALKQTDSEGKFITLDAAPDMSNAPYPLIITGNDTGNYLLQSHIASHGFVMAIVRSSGLDATWDYGVIDQPLDMLFVVDQIATNPPDGLEAVIDTDHVGVTGYSGDGLVSLALSGARIDPDYYLSYCDQAPTMQPAVSGGYLTIVCTLAQKWDEFSIHVGGDITVSTDGLWQPVTDSRIKAVMPMGADGAWLFGEHGLAPAVLPALFIQATEESPYQPIEAEFIFENFGSPERAMISFVGMSHDMVYQPDPAMRMKHFAVAFFGYHLQGREDYAYYFSEDFVSQFDDLAWGVYHGE